MRHLILILFVLSLGAFSAQASHPLTQKGGITSGGGDFDPITDCIDRHSNMGTIMNESDLICGSLTREEKECIKQGLNFAMQIEDIISTCSNLELY